jgi:hypothetical protein
VIEKSGFKVALLGLNSSWLARKKAGSGSMIVGESQVIHALDKTKLCDVRIAIVHHPFDWLKPFDREFTETALKRSCDFILSGHKHSEQVILEKSLEGVSAIVSAGACYGGAKYPNCYNFCFFNIVSREGLVFLRRYSPRRGEWVKDVYSTGDENDGKVQFNFSTRDLIKPKVLLHYEFEHILKVFPFEDHLKSRIKNEPNSPTFREYYFDRIREAEETLGQILPYSRAIFIDTLLYDSLSKYKPCISYVKEYMEKYPSGYETEKLIQAFARLLIDEYFIEKEKRTV